MDRPMYKSIAASILQSGLSLPDLLALAYGDIKEDLEKGITPLCLDLARRKTSVQFVTARAVHAYFRKTAQKFAGAFKGRNPYSPHLLRAAFRKFLSNHKVDPLYIEYWMGHKIPEQLSGYINKSRESWRKTYREQAEPHLTQPQYKNGI